jgi:DNA-binding transcriptional LysR family regulator
MTLVQLQHFIALARTGSFVKASAAVHLTQPALSRSLKALEEELGQLLFDRVGRRIELTAFGAETLQRAQLLVEDAQDLKKSGRPSAMGDGGRIRLGLSSGPGVMFTVPLLTHVARHYPRLHVEVSRANTDTLVRQLHERAVDALIVDVRSLKPAPDLHVEHLVEMDGAFLCRPGHPLAALRSVSAEQLLAYPVASTPLSDELARILVERYGEHAHPQEMVTLLSDEISHLIELAQASDAVVLAIRAAAPQLQALPLKPALNARARFGLVTLAGRAASPFLPEIARLMDSVFGSDQ